MSIEAIDKLVKAQYYFGFPDVEFSPKKFYKFLGKSIGMTKNVPGRGSRQASTLIGFQQASTASWNPAWNEITLPLWLAQPEKAKRILGPYAESMKNALVVLTNGFIIHESLHSIFTYGLRISEQVKEVEYKIWLENEVKLSRETIRACIQLVEDLYIENRPMTAQIWLHATNQILFNNEVFEECKKALKEEETFETKMNLLIAYKRVDLRGKIRKILPAYTEILDQCFAIKHELVNAVNKQQRTDIIAKLALLFYEISPEMNKEKSQQQVESKSEEMKSSEIAENYLPEEETEDDSIEDRFDGEFSDGSKEAVKDQEEKKQMKMAKKEGKLSGFSWYGVNSDQDLSKVCWVGSSEHLQTLPNNGKVAKKLTESLKHITAFRSFRKAPENIGIRPKRSLLHRIASDSKVYRKVEQKREKDLPEVVTLVDASGSMSGRIEHVNEAGQTELHSLFMVALATAKDISKALLESRIKHTTVAHTTTWADVALILLSGKGMRKAFTANSKQWKRYGNISKSGNIDGIAVRECAKLFTGKSDNKIMLVLSDGMPCSPGHGISGDTFLRQQLKIARKSGVKVIGVSLVNHVVDYNSKLYGQNNHIDASQSMLNSIGESLRKLF